MPRLRVAEPAVTMSARIPVRVAEAVRADAESKYIAPSQVLRQIIVRHYAEQGRS